MVDKARRQLGLFRALLIIISTIIMALIIYTLTLDKIHDIAMLKLMGARNGIIVGLILQQALLIGALGYGLAYWLGTFAFPKFPRLVVIETPTWNKPIEPYSHPFTLIPNPAVAGRNLEYYRYDGAGIRGSPAELLRCMSSVTVQSVCAVLHRLL